MSDRYERTAEESSDHPAYIRAFNAAAKRATAINHEMIVAKRREFGRDGFNVYAACKTDADYYRYEIVKPGQPPMSESRMIPDRADQEGTLMDRTPYIIAHGRRFICSTCRTVITKRRDVDAHKCPPLPTSKEGSTR